MSGLFYDNVFRVMPEGFQMLMMHCMCNEGFYLFIEKHLEVIQEQILALNPESEDFVAKARELHQHRAFWLSLLNMLKKEQANVENRDDDV